MKKQLVRIIDCFPGGVNPFLIQLCANKKIAKTPEIIYTGIILFPIKVFPPSNTMQASKLVEHSDKIAHLLFTANFVAGILLRVKNAPNEKKNIDVILNPGKGNQISNK